MTYKCACCSSLVVALGQKSWGDDGWRCASRGSRQVKVLARTIGDDDWQGKLMKYGVSVSLQAAENADRT